MTKRHISVENDYSLIRPFVEERQVRISNRSAALKSKQFGQYAKWISIMLVSLGVLVFLVLWGVSLLSEKPAPKIITTERIVEKPSVIKVELPTVPTAPQSTQQASDIANALSSVEQAGSESPVPIVTNYTIFRSIDFETAGYNDVVTGLNYDSSESAFPENQYCYLEKVLNSGQLKIDLASANGIGTLTWNKFLPSLGIKRNDFERAQDKCLFLSK